MAPSVTDHLNVYTVRDIANVSNYFLIGGGKADLYKVNKVAHGTVSKVWYNDAKAGLTRRMTVYTPAGYETSKQKYPVALSLAWHRWRRGSVDGFKDVLRKFSITSLRKARRSQ